MLRRTINLILVIILAGCASLAGLAPDAHAASASLYLAPGSGTYVIGGSFSVGVKVNSGGGVGINAAEGSISYDSSLLDVTGVSKGSSIFPFWTTEPSHSGATVRFGGGAPPPAYTGASGHIITINFKAKKAGTAAVRFTSGAVLANDGKGTNILASMGSASYTISPKVSAPPTQKPVQPKEEPKPVERDYNLPKIISATHPDQNKWYKNNKVEFKWELPSGVTGVSIGFDDEPTTDPGPVADGSFSEKIYENVEFGVWYLHLKFKDASRWGTIAHYRVMIDTNPPLPFEVRVESGGIGESPELFFETEDKESGLEKYEIFIGSLEHQAHEVAIEKKSFLVTGLSAGEHTALVRAIDKAGNERVAMVNFSIAALPAPEIKDYPREIKPSDQFYLSGTAFENVNITVYIEKNNQVVATSSVRSDNSGNWFYIHENKLDNGRYTAWVKATNDKGIDSEPSKKVSFLVTPPIFAVIGDYVVNYFTVFMSLIFLILLIIISIFFLVGLVRRRLKKETVEIEEILERNAEAMKAAIDQEFTALTKYEGKAAYKKEKANTKSRLKDKVDENVKRSLKEVHDVEEILK